MCFRPLLPIMRTMIHVLSLTWSIDHHKLAVSCGQVQSKIVVLSSFLRTDVQGSQYSHTHGLFLLAEGLYDGVEAHFNSMTRDSPEVLLKECRFLVRLLCGRVRAAPS